MNWRCQNVDEWHQVAWAWFPVCFDCVTYWLEQPPYEQRVKFRHFDNYWEYRRCLAQ